MSDYSPDLALPIDLALFDLTPQDLVDQALADAATKLPGWTPRESNTEVVLLETQALMAAETIYAINRVPRAVLGALLQLYGLTPDPGAAATMQVALRYASPVPVTVPAGTTIRLTVGDDALEFTLTAGVTLPSSPANGSVTVTVTAVEPTARFNGATGTVEVVDQVNAINQVIVSNIADGGRDPETLDDFLVRGSQLLQRLVTTLVLPQHFTAAALEQPGVYRALTVDLYDPAVGAAPGSTPGAVTVAVLGPGGAPLTTAAKTALAAALRARALASLTITVIDPSITYVPVTGTVVCKAGADPAAVEAACTAAVGQYLSPLTWTWGAQVFRNELISLLDQVPGVDRVDALDEPYVDMTLGGVAPLAAADYVSITALAAS